MAREVCLLKFSHRFPKTLLCSERRENTRRGFRGTCRVLRALLLQSQWNTSNTTECPAGAISQYPQNIGYRCRLLLELNRQDMLEVNSNIYWSNLKFQKYMRSSNATSRQPYHKAYYKIIWFHCSFVDLLSPSDFNSTIVVKMLSLWSMTEDIHESWWDQRMLPFFAIKHCRRFAEAS